MPFITPLDVRSTSRIVVLRALQIGDLLVSVPMFRALRGALPRARIALVGLPWASWFVDRFPSYVDELIEFPGLPGLPERTPDVAAFPRFLHHVQTRRFDLALQAHGSGAYVNTLAALFGAAHCAGFFTPGEWCPDPRRFVPYPDEGRETARGLALLRALGIEATDESLELPLLERERRRAAETLADHGIGAAPYACLHPGGRNPSRRWPPERFAAVADWLHAQGLRVVLTGSAEDAPIIAAVARAARAPLAGTAGRLDLGEMAAVIAGARLLVCNDTSVSHVAAALRVPSVIVTLGSDPERWAPADRDLHRSVWEPIACRPCAHGECPIGHPCATAVTPARVTAVARALLDRAA